MTEQTFHDPHAEGLARAAQAAALTVTIAEALARLQYERSRQRASEDEGAATALRADREASHASARVAWTPALNDRWLQRSDVSQLLGAWAPAAGWADTDPDAHEAVERTEQRLAQMHPEALARFARGRAEGMSAAAALAEAAPVLAAAPSPDTHVQAPKALDARIVPGHTITPRASASATSRRR